MIFTRASQGMRYLHHTDIPITASMMCAVCYLWSTIIICKFDSTSNHMSEFVKILFVVEIKMRVSVISFDAATTVFCYEILNLIPSIFAFDLLKKHFFLKIFSFSL